MCVIGHISQVGKQSLRGRMSSQVLKSKSSHRSRSSVESPCQQSPGKLSPDSVLAPQDGGGREILCIPAPPAPPWEQLCPRPVAARTSLQKVFMSGNSHPREAVAQLISVMHGVQSTAAEKTSPTLQMPALHTASFPFAVIFSSIIP